MIRMRKSAALIMAGVLVCSTPLPVMAAGNTDVVESLLDSGIDFLASDPQKAVSFMPRICWISRTLQMIR